MLAALQAWMVSEHNRLGFPEQWCSETFGQASFGNGIAAILSGLLASVLARWGPGMPFVAAMLANVAAAAVIFRTWCLPHRLHPVIIPSLSPPPPSSLFNSRELWANGLDSCSIAPFLEPHVGSFGAHLAQRWNHRGNCVV